MKFKSQGLSSQTWLSATFILVSAALLSKILGFARDILVAKNFGASAEVDAYMVALTLPSVIGGGIGFALSTSMLTLYGKRLAKLGLEEASKLGWGVIISGGAVSIAVMLLLILTSTQIIHVIAPSLSEPTSDLAASLLRWLSFLVFGSAFFYILSGIFNAAHHFRIPAFGDVIGNAFVLLVLVLLSSLVGIYALAFGMIIGAIVVIGIQVAFLFMKGNMSSNIFCDSNIIRDVTILAIPVLFYEVFSQISPLIENFFASGLREGSISALGFGKKLPYIMVTLIALNIGRGSFPALCHLVAEQKHGEARDLFVKLNKQVIITFTPIIFFMIYFREEIVRGVFMRGAFDNTALDMTVDAFIYYSGGLLFLGLMPVFVRSCYAFSDMRTPLKAVGLGVILHVPIMYVLTPIMGIGGIALSSNLVVVPALLIMGLSLHYKYESLNSKELLKCLLLSLVCSSLGLVPLTVFEISNVFGLVLSGLIFCLFYFILCFFLMRNEVMATVQMIKRTLSQNQSAGPLP